MSSLTGRERDQREEPTRLGGIVVGNRGFEVLTLRSRLAKLPAQPAQQAHRCLVGHTCRLSSQQTEDGEG